VTDTEIKDAPTVAAYQRMYRALREIESLAGMDMGLTDLQRLDRIQSLAKATADAAVQPKEAK